jgi:hypothetical protein
MNEMVVTVLHTRHKSEKNEKQQQPLFQKLEESGD